MTKNTSFDNKFLLTNELIGEALNNLNKHVYFSTIILLNLIDLEIETRLQHLLWNFYVAREWHNPRIPG